MARQNLRSSILELLKKDRLKSFSGQELAEQFGVTRAAVWKAVEALRSDGCHIDGVQNVGYRLAWDADIISPEIIAGYLTEDAKEFYHIECYEKLSSTNTVLKARAADTENAVPEGTVLVAETQTAGKGRMGRSFYSPKGSGIYTSVLLRPRMPAEKAVHITAAAAAAGAKAFEAAFPALEKGSVAIKWVNDLFINGYKVSGILTEGMISVETGNLDYAVLGIGFNLAEPDGGWPEDISEIAGGLPDGSAGLDARARITAEFLNEFLVYYRVLPEKSYLEEYRSRQFVIGRKVDVVRSTALPGEAALNAEAVGLDDECRLIVHYDDGTEEALSSGEVRIRPR